MPYIGRKDDFAGVDGESDAFDFDVKAKGEDHAMQEWTLVYESIQRVHKSGGEFWFTDLEPGVQATSGGFEALSSADDAAAQASDPPAEEVTMVYAKIEWTY